MRESVKLNIEGLQSLKSLRFGTKTADNISMINNLPSLTKLYLNFSGQIDNDKLAIILDQVTQIKELYLEGNFSYLNLDSLVNLRMLELSGTIAENFNFELFKNLCDQLENIKIELNNIDGETFIKLFDGYNFPYLTDFSVKYFNVKRLKKEFFNRFSTLRRLEIHNCNFEVIERDSLSNLEELCLLDLSDNQIKYIEKNVFSSLKDLQRVDLNFNNIGYLDRKFIGLRESTELLI